MKPISKKLNQAFLLISVLPLVLVFLVYGRISGKHTTNQVAFSFSNLTESLSDDIERGIEETIHPLQFLSRLLFIRERIIEDYDVDGLAADLLIQAKREKSSVDEIILIKNSSGDFQYFASTIPSRMAQKISPSENSFFRKLILSEKPQFQFSKQNLLTSPLDSSLQFAIDIPFKAEDEEVHVLRALLSYGKMRSQVSKLSVMGEPQGKNSMVLIFDQQGDLLFSPVQSDQILEIENALTLAKEALKRNQIRIYFGKEEYIFHLHDHGSMGWKILVLQHSNLVFRWYSELLNTFMIFLGVTIFSILVLASKMASAMSRPIQNLAKAAIEIASRNYHPHIEDSTVLEIHHVAQSFQQMATSVESSQKDLETLNQSLEKKVLQRTEEIALKNEQLSALSNQLSKYLSPQIYQSIFKSGEEVKIQAQRKKLTVFFSDIKGFTTTSEEMESEDLIRMLNHYLEEMAQIALEYGGTIDKFIGDAIMVFFGDPNSLGEREDARQCVRMAIAMQERMAQLRILWEEQGVRFPFHIRCGINTGFCTVGNFGSKSRMDYTIIGRNVNLASRLESNAKQDKILISEETWLLIREEIECTENEPIRVKGISREIQTYEVVGYLGEKNSQKLIFYDEGLAFSFYPSRIQDKQKAKEVLSQALESLK